MSNCNRLFPLESINEFDVVEITYNGTEILKSPFDPLENFEFIANNIDFEESSEDDKKEKIQNEPPVIPQNIHSDKEANIRSALNEVCALIDILTVAKDRNYLLMEPIHLQFPEPRVSLALSGKKTSLNHAADILLKGSESLLHKYSQQCDIRRRVNALSFHEQLMSLRRYWRLCPSGNLIVGDYGLTSVGSNYRYSANFEVKDSEPSGILHISLQPHQRVSARLHISLIDGDQTPHLLAKLSDVIFNGSDVDEFSSDDLFLDFEIPTQSNDILWEARNSLINREIFHRLATEATQLTSDFPVLLFCNKIVCTVLTDVQIYICLEEHYWDSESTSTTTPAAAAATTQLLNSSLSSSNHMETMPFTKQFPQKPIFNLLLRRLLLSNLKKSTLKNVSSVVMNNISTNAVEDKRYLVSLIHLSRHMWLRNRVLTLLEQFSRECRDPIVNIISVDVSSLIESRVRLRIVSRGYEGYRGFGTGCILQVTIQSQQGITAIGSDAQVMEFGFNAHHLLDWFKIITSNHVISLVKALALDTPWNLVAYSACCPYGPIEGGGNGSVSVCLLQSPDLKRTVCIRCGPETGVRFFVSTDAKAGGDPTSLMKNLSQMPEMPFFREVDLNAVRGTSTVQKMEMLLAVLLPI